MKWHGLYLASLLTAALPLGADLQVHESFDSFADGGSGWQNAWAGKPGEMVLEPTGLQFGDLEVSGGAAGKQARVTAKRGLNLTIDKGKTVWGSVLVRQSDDTNWWDGGLGLHFNEDGSPGDRLTISAGKLNGLMFNQQDPPYGGPVHGMPFAAEQTYLVVFRLDGKESGLWLSIIAFEDPAQVPGMPPSIRPQPIKTTFPFTLKSLTLKNWKTTSTYDEIRLGDTYADVVPGLAKKR